MTAEKLETRGTGGRGVGENSKKKGEGQWKTFPENIIGSSRETSPVPTPLSLEWMHRLAWEQVGPGDLTFVPGNSRFVMYRKKPRVQQKKL